MYVNLLLVPVCPEDPCSDCMDFDITIEGIRYAGRACVLEGGQRLLLDEASMNRVIDALLAEECVQLRVGMHFAEVTPNCFGRSYEAVMRFSL